jgi:3'(2'), 5'-bisphosphate nucleotidase
MLNFQSREVKFSLHALQQASLLVSRIQSEMVSSALNKEDRSPVTVADFASQALVAYLLYREFPDDILVGEEDSTALRVPERRPVLERVAGFLAGLLPDASPEKVCDWIDRGCGQPAQRFWTLDPIDGTKGFLRGDQFAIALAWIENGQVQVGTLGCPNLTAGYQPDAHGQGSLVIAERLRGAWVTPLGDREFDFSPLKVSEIQDPSRARILRSFESGHTNVSQIDQVADAMGVKAEPVRMDSQAKYAVLATGHGDLYLRLLSPKKPDYREKIWDQAAGSLIIEEAGGWVTDLDGKPLDFTAGRTLANNRGILASNGHLHPLALQTLRTVGA